MARSWWLDTVDVKRGGANDSGRSGVDFHRQFVLSIISVDKYNATGGRGIVRQSAPLDLGHVGLLHTDGGAGLADTASIIVSDGSKRDTSPVKVMVVDSGGNPLTGSSVTWSHSSATVGKRF